MLALPDIFAVLAVRVQRERNYAPRICKEGDPIERSYRILHSYSCVNVHLDGLHHRLLSFDEFTL